MLTDRLDIRVGRDFPTSEVYTIRTLLAEIAPAHDDDHDLAGTERIQAAVVVLAAGDTQRFLAAATLAQQDWRDLLVQAGLANADWRDRLTETLGK